MKFKIDRDAILKKLEIIKLVYGGPPDYCDYITFSVNDNNKLQIFSSKGASIFLSTFIGDANDGGTDIQVSLEALIRTISSFGSGNIEANSNRHKLVLKWKHRKAALNRHVGEWHWVPDVDPANKRLAFKGDLKGHPGQLAIAAADGTGPFSYVACFAAFTAASDRGNMLVADWAFGTVGEQDAPLLIPIETMNIVKKFGKNIEVHKVYGAGDKVRSITFTDVDGGFCLISPVGSEEPPDYSGVLAEFDDYNFAELDLDGLLKEVRAHKKAMGDCTIKVKILEDEIHISTVLEPGTNTEYESVIKASNKCVVSFSVPIHHLLKIGPLISTPVQVRIVDGSWLILSSIENNKNLGIISCVRDSVVFESQKK